MALQMSVGVRNAQESAIWSTIGASPIIRFYSGAVPASCATAASGTLLASGTLPSSPEGAPAAGAAAINGPWNCTGAAGAGLGTVMGYWRIWDAAVANCHMQGTVGQTGGTTGDLNFDNPNIAQNQAFSVTAFTLTEGNA